MRKLRSKIDYLLKHNLIIQKAYKLIMGTYFKFIGIFIKTDEKLILFNAHGRKFNDSPRAIYNYMIEKNLHHNYKIVWALDNPEKYDIPNAKKVEMDTLQYFLTALKAKYWVSCVNIERGLKFKKKSTKYLNTWHGTPIKHIGNAVNKRKDFDFSDIDLFCYSGEYEKDIYIKDFNVYEQNLILSGLPRNDELYTVTEQEIDNLKNKLNLPMNKKVILYAPTWRDSKDKGKNYTLDIPLSISKLKKELGEDYILLLRTHAYTNNLVGIKFDDFIRDYSEYPEINDLLKIADILISDYSATIFDYSILEKPIICFGYDYDLYSEERGFYINIKEELPGNVVTNQEELINKIKIMDYKVECIKTKDFKTKFLEVGGNATEICIKKLLEI